MIFFYFFLSEVSIIFGKEEFRRKKKEAAQILKSTSNNMWKEIWKIRDPGKICLLWRACNNIIPTKENIFKMRIVPDPFCPICDLTVEIYH
jgi:hypothetical protein